MKNFALCILTLGIASSAFGTACVSGDTLTQYIAQGSCSFTANGQSYTLTDFTFVNVTLLLAATTDEGAFTLSESSGANGPNVSITQTGAISGLVGTETDYIGFDIISQNPSIGFSNVNLANTTTGSGISLGVLAEEDCYGGLLPVPSRTNLLSLGSGGLTCLGGGLSTGASIATPIAGANVNIGIPLGYPFTNSVDVLKELNLTEVLGSSGQVITQGFTTDAAPAPEPGSFFLGGCGLLGVALALRRRVSR
jgi:hypothetical protein